jgi:hypothetical protein
MGGIAALVITGYHEKEAQFGSDVAECYASRRLRRGRNITFYAVQDNQGSVDPVVEKVDREIRNYLADRDPPDLILDVHVGAAERVHPQGARSKSECGEMDLFCAKPSVPVLCRLTQLFGQGHVFSDVPLPHEDGEQAPSESGDWTLAKTGLPTVYVEPYLWMPSIEARDQPYWREVRQTARLLNTLYDVFATYGGHGELRP